MKRPVAVVVAATLLAVSAGAAGGPRAHAAPDGGTGRWGPLVKWPIIPIHMVMTRDGRLLTYGTDERGRQTGYLVYDVYDPATGTHRTLPNHTQTDIFCATQVTLVGTGEILIAGGDVFTHDDMSPRPTLNHGNDNTTVFDPSTDALTSLTPMHFARWYSTEVVLPDGRVLVAGGTGADGITRATVPEIWDPATRAWSTLPGAEIPASDWYYPKLFVMPNGKVLGIGTETMWVVDPDAPSRDPDAWWRWRRGSITSYGPTAGTDGHRHNTGFRSTAVMFVPGRILLVGAGSTDASIIDVGSGRPVVTDVAKMHYGRQWPNSTVLPDGSVLVTGGSSDPDDITLGKAGTAYRQAELWSPATGRWTTLPAEASPRLYHSAALLLPDATVMTGGGGAYKLPAGEDQSKINHLDAQVFTPGYLESGAVRPRITRAPTSIMPGDELAVTTTGDVARLVLIKLPSVTHSFNNEQRLIPLAFHDDGAGRLRATTPNNRIAPPGYYYLFAVSRDGVPSLASIVAISTTGK